MNIVETVQRAISRKTAEGARIDTQIDEELCVLADPEYLAGPWRICSANAIR